MDAQLPRVFCVGVPPSPLGFLPAVGTVEGGRGRCRRCPSTSSQSREGHTGEAGGRPGAIFGKEFGNPSSKSVRKVPARWMKLPRGLPLRLNNPPPQQHAAGPPRWQHPRSPPACLFLERETTREKLGCKPPPAQARREALHLRLPTHHSQSLANTLNPAWVKVTQICLFCLKKIAGRGEPCEPRLWGDEG